MDVSIIIINYNTLSLIKSCIESIKNNTLDISYEIIVVDNNSQDGSKEYFKRQDEIKYIYNNANYGFGKANNIGVNYAEGKYLFFLNSDTILIGNVIKKLLIFSKTSNNLGALGTILIDEDNNCTFSYGDFLSFKRYFLKVRSFLLPIDTVKNEIKNDFIVDFVSGADLFIRKDNFLIVNGFDENFFMYFEEEDLQRRLHNIGLKQRILGVSEIIHLEGGSFDSKISFKRKKMILQSQMLYINKNFKIIERICLKIISIMSILRDVIANNYSMKELKELTKLTIKR